MKKFLSLILVLVFCVSAFAACGPNKTEQAVENATAFVKNMYKAYLDETETAKDFELVSKVMVGGVSYTVTWTSDNDAVKVVEGSDGKVTIDVNEESAEVVQYKLTAVVSAEDGTKGEPLTFKFKVPASNLTSIPDALKLPDETFVTVKGKVTIINTPWDDGYKNISVTIEDNDGNKLYLYRLATNVKLGDIITVKGVMATYNGARQVAAGATAEITGHEDVVVTYKPVTIPEALEEADNTQIEVSGTVVEIGTEWSDQYKNISVTIADAAGNKLYLYRLGTKVELGDIITVKGIMATYNNARQVAAGATAEITGKGEVSGGGNQGGDDVDVPEGAVKYTFADYEKGEQYGKNEVHKLDDLLTVTTDEAHFREELRLYHTEPNPEYAPEGYHATAVFASSKVIKSIIFNVGNKDDTMKVYGSVDGTTWTLIEDVAVTSAYADHKVEIENSTYKFIKIEPTAKQIRVKSVTVEYTA